MVANKISRSKKYKLTGLLKKNGFDRWRIVANGKSSVTGEECTFFIEFYIVNPALSPNTCILGFKSRLPQTPADLQNALAGTENEKSLLMEESVQPSFVMVKAGKLSKGGKQINAYFPSNNLVVDTNDYIIKVGSTDENTCFIKDDTTGGSITVSKTDLLLSPEILGNVGTISWNLRYSTADSFFPNYNSNMINWSCFGARTAIAGVILMDGEKFIVNKDLSYGYFDKNWGHSFTDPFMHLSSSNLISNISRQRLFNSCFAVQGEYNKRLSVLISIEGKKLEFHADSSKKYNIRYECTQMPQQHADSEVKLHWSVSMNDKKNYVDIDIICNASELFVRDYECPEGKRKVLKVLGGGSGSGDLKLYRMVKKDLELIDDVHIGSCLCEFGHIDIAER